MPSLLNASHCHRQTGIEGPYNVTSQSLKYSSKYDFASILFVLSPYNKARGHKALDYVKFQSINRHSTKQDEFN